MLDSIGGSENPPGHSTSEQDAMNSIEVIKREKSRIIKHWTGRMHICFFPTF